MYFDKEVNKYYSIEDKEILEEKVLTEKELDFYRNYKIPFHDTLGLRRQLDLLEAKIIEAVEQGLLTKNYNESTAIQKGHFIHGTTSKIS